MPKLMPCYLTHTGSFLPGKPIANQDIERFLGDIDGEADIKQRVLRMNGIQTRHYAQDTDQNPTDDVYGLAAQAVHRTLTDSGPFQPPTFLAAGTTFAPLAAPGIASILHHRIRRDGWLDYPVEISSHGGVCTASAAGMVAAIRAVQTNSHQSSISVGVEHASEVLKSNVFHPIDDRSEHDDVRRSQWFMSVFLRFMLSDGAGAFLFQNKPASDGISLRVNWTHSLSFAHATELCMKMPSRSAVLSQDVAVLSRHLFTSSRSFLSDAMETHGESLDQYDQILPHLSSFFFRRRMERIMQEFAKESAPPVSYWTNLATAGNTGSASAYVMLDEYLRGQSIREGQRLLLFIPESGQFNFVLVSLTAVILT
ncbi:3-oxoacyl-[acyl-carrier-protein] synthase 3 [Rubripirellula obstinata]|uniref:3-oxoacyl-[acyl-carrier-protein] synthase 3 n=1 Tax=Rubripirellula obstinata TaxID=406547 RepID=A0A5B1CJG7_9BACT|nr:hypothetical protein [Rubripirellula obstinata]KAA1260075.1 3-oxoacyl-[acyl-carrier-protein] synthase 3 [Rubripirellula obstinata]